MKRLLLLLGVSLFLVGCGKSMPDGVPDAPEENGQTAIEVRETRV